MANEAVKIEQGNNFEVTEFTVADQFNISGGALCQLSGARTAFNSLITSGDVFAGIAALDKEASDGSTTLGLYTRGVFDIVAQGVDIAAGEMVCLSGANQIRLATTAEVVTGVAFGKALETITAGSAGQVKIGGLA